MWLMPQQDATDDFVIATGETNTVQRCVEVAFDQAGVPGWHRVKLQRLAATKDFDHKRAQQVGGALERLLASGAERPMPARALLEGAARYYLRVDDDSHDLRAPGGFEDDEQVLRAVVAVVGVR